MKWLGLVGLTVVVLVVLTWAPTMGISGSGIGLLPPETSLNLFAGETGSYQLKLHNGNGRSVTISLLVTVVQVPPGGLSSDLSLSYPRSVVLKTGNSVIPVTVVVGVSAAPGVYALANTVTF